MSTTGSADPGREAIVAALERHGVEYVVIGGADAHGGSRRLDADLAGVDGPP